MVWRRFLGPHRLLNVGGFVVLGTALSAALLAQGTQQQPQAPPSLKESGSSNASSQAPSQTGAGQPAAPANSAAGTAAQTAPQASAEEEAQDYQMLQNEPDPDKQIQMVKDFVQKYPASQWLSDVYFEGAAAAEKKNDVTGSLDFGRKSLKLQPDNLRSMILVAGLLPLPQALPAGTAQKQQQLSEAENDANRALQLLSAIQPPPSGSAAQFSQTKAVVEAQIHSALGMAHLEESTMAVNQAPPPELAALEKRDPHNADDDISPALDACRQGEGFQTQYRLDDAINAYSQAAQQAGQDTGIASYANAVVQQLNVEKSELAMAEQEFKTVAAGPQPAAQDFYRLGEVYTREDKLDDAIGAFTQAEQHAPGTLIQKYAAQMIQQVQTLKAKNPQPQNSTPPAAGSGTPPSSAASGTAAAPASTPTSPPAKQ